MQQANIDKKATLMLWWFKFIIFQRQVVHHEKIDQNDKVKMRSKNCQALSKIHFICVLGQMCSWYGDARVLAELF